MEEEELDRKEVVEKLTNAESIVEDLRKTAKQEAQDHSTEIRKHKAVFIQLEWNQRQLEADLGRALRQVEATRQELDSVLEGVNFVGSETTHGNSKDAQGFGPEKQGFISNTEEI